MSFSKTTLATVTLLLVLNGGTGIRGARGDTQPSDWTSFRNGGESIAGGARLPLSWSIETGENIAWEAKLPGRGVSSPIVVGGRVVVTCSSGPRRDRLHVLAFDSDTGAPLWHRQFWATGRTLVHPTSAVAANTPASDGKRIFAFFSSNDLIALDLEGNVQWYRGLAQTHPLAGNDVGMSSSPAVAGDVVVVQSEAHAESFVEAIDTSSGATRWELQRPRQATWCSPVAYRQEVAGREVDAVLLQTLGRIDAYEARSGQPIWSLAADCESIPSAVVADAVYVPASGLQRVEPAKGAREAQITWKEARLQPGSSSPIVYRDHAYIVNSAGVLACGRIGSSVAPWKLRLGGRFWATPVASGNYLYCINAAGTAYVVDLGDATAQANEPPTKGKIVSTNEFGDEVFGSPAVAGNALYVRSHARLWKIAAESTSALRGGEDADSLSDIR